MLCADFEHNGDKKRAKTYHVAPSIPSQGPCRGDGGGGEGAFLGAYAGELELSNWQ